MLTITYEVGEECTVWSVWEEDRNALFQFGIHLLGLGLCVVLDRGYEKRRREAGILLGFRLQEVFLLGIRIIFFCWSYGYGVIRVFLSDDSIRHIYVILPPPRPPPAPLNSSHSPRRAYG